MPRKKKEEAKEVIKAPDYGTGMTRFNNMLKAGIPLNEIREGKRNE